MMLKKRKKKKRKQELQELLELLELQVLRRQQVLMVLEKQVQVKEKVKEQVLVQLIQDTITHFKNNKKIKPQQRKQLRTINQFL
tara:strand:+ start:383 stop:634 length:252 start_codon:yes stop_codon:yes gene_type:complete